MFAAQKEVEEVKWTATALVLENPLKKYMNAQREHILCGQFLNYRLVVWRGQLRQMSFNSGSLIIIIIIINEVDL